MNIIGLLAILVILIGAVAIPTIIRQNQTVPKITPVIQRETISQPLTLTLEPIDSNFSVNEVKKLTLTLSSPADTKLPNIASFKTTIQFPKEYFRLPPASYVDISPSGFSKIVRVDGPVQANESGNIIIELKNHRLKNRSQTNIKVIAIITFEAIKQTSTPQTISVNQPQIIDENSQPISTVTKQSHFTVK